MSKKAFDIEDPDTWPDTVEELDSMDAETPATKVVETAPDKTEEAPAEKTEEAPAEKTEEAPDEKAKGSLPPTGIETKDGEVLPYEVLKAARDEIAALKEQLARQAGAGVPEKKEAAPPASSAPELPADVAAKVAAIRTAWGDDIAEQAVNQFLLQQQLAQQNAQIAALQQTIDSQRAIEQRREDDEVADAIAASPKMAEWAAATDKTLFEQAIALHQTLVSADKVYAAMDWRKRMQVLPAKVMAVFAGATEGPAPVPAAGQKQQTVASGQPKTGPVSLTDVSGTAPSSPKSALDEIKDLEGFKLVEYMDRQARTPGKMDQLLRALM